MVLRVIKKLGILLLTLFLSISLASCNFKFNFNNNFDPSITQAEKNKINYINQLLERYYYSELNLDLSKITSVDELLSYTDVHTRIYEESTSAIAKDNFYLGVGLTISEHSSGLLVVGVNEQLNIYQQIYVGDIITSINGIKLKDLDYEEKRIHLLGNEIGEVKILSILRLNKEITETVYVVDVPYYSIYSHKFNDIGYIKIERFATNTANYFKQALIELENSQIEGLIIDLRNNGGGYLGAVYDILTEFIDGDEPMFYMYETKKDEFTEFFPKQGTQKKAYPITLLVNQGSASASEILAGVMQKKGYKLFGEKTYGKDVYQVGLQLKNYFPAGYAINITNGYWLLSKTESVYGGLIPDVIAYESGINSLVYPALIKEYYKGFSNPYIGVYQYLISLTVEGDYIPNHFDDDFQEMVKQYQALNDLTVTGILDEATLKLLINLFIETKKDYSYDELLNASILDMEKGLNEN